MDFNLTFGNVTTLFSALLNFIRIFAAVSLIYAAFIAVHHDTILF